MSKLNLYLIRGTNLNGVNKMSYQEKCHNKLIKSDKEFIIYQYFVAANNQKECRELYIPYLPLGIDTQKNYFFENFTCIEICKYNELNENWPQKNNKGYEYIYKTELEKIGFNESECMYMDRNKLNFKNIKEYLSGLPQIVCIDLMFKFNNKDNTIKIQNEILYLPMNFNKISLNFIDKTPFISWIRKPLNQLSRNIYNKYPDKAVEAWNQGMLTPNCDTTDKYCKEKCCHHYLSEFYPDNFDVNLMSELIYTLKCS